MAKLVSVAGGGDLGTEIDLHTLSQDIDAEVVEYEPETYPALYFRFKEGGAAVMLFRSGKYNIAGADSIENLHSTHRRLTNRIAEMLETTIDADDECELRNLVYVDDFDQAIDFQRLIDELGVKNIEYEPETFPSLDYRPPDNDGLFKIFSSGKITFTGTTDPTTVEIAFENLKQKIELVN